MGFHPSSGIVHGRPAFVVVSAIFEGVTAEVGTQMEEDDVARERARVEAITDTRGHAILTRDLRKVYPAQVSTLLTSSI